MSWNKYRSLTLLTSENVAFSIKKRNKKKQSSLKKHAKYQKKLFYCIIVCAYGMVIKRSNKIKEKKVNFKCYNSVSHFKRRKSAYWFLMKSGVKRKTIVFILLEFYFFMPRFCYLPKLGLLTDFLTTVLRAHSLNFI